MDPPSENKGKENEKNEDDEVPEKKRRLDNNGNAEPLVPPEEKKAERKTPVKGGAKPKAPSASAGTKPKAPPARAPVIRVAKPPVALRRATAQPPQPTRAPRAKPVTLLDRINTCLSAKTDRTSGITKGDLTKELNRDKPVVAISLEETLDKAVRQNKLTFHNRRYYLPNTVIPPRKRASTTTPTTVRRPAAAASNSTRGKAAQDPVAANPRCPIVVNARPGSSNEGTINLAISFRVVETLPEKTPKKRQADGEMDPTQAETPKKRGRPPKIPQPDD